MLVVAKHWLNYNGVWHKGGDEFEVDDLESVRDYVEVKEQGYVSEVFPPEPKRRGRPRKTEE